MQLWRLNSHPDSLPSIHGGKRSTFKIVFHPMTWSTLNVWWALNLVILVCVVVGYKVDEFTHTWLAECLVIWSHIYTGFTDKVSMLTNFLLEPVCEQYSFLDQAVNDFEHGLDSIPAGSVNNWMHPLMSLMPCLLQFLWGFYAQSKLSMIILDCSFLLQ